MDENIMGEIIDEYSFVADFIETHGVFIILAVVVFVIITIISETIGWILSRIASRTADSKSQIYRLCAKMVRVVGVITAIITGLGTLGINVSALVAGLGLTGFALGFAIKDALSNTLSGVLIILYQPFDVSDEIEMMGSRGLVKEVNLRYLVLDGEESEVILPNSLCFTQKIIKIKKLSQDPSQEVTV